MALTVINTSHQAMSTPFGDFDPKQKKIYSVPTKEMEKFFASKPHFFEIVRRVVIAEPFVKAVEPVIIPVTPVAPVVPPAADPVPEPSATTSTESAPSEEKPLEEKPVETEVSPVGKPQRKNKKEVTTVTI